MGKVKCFRNIQCQICNIKGMLQVFYNASGEPRYGRIRHYDKGKFYYHKQDLQYIREMLHNIGHSNIGQNRGNVGLKLKEISSFNENKSGRSLAWSRTSASQAGDPGSNPGDRTTK